MLADHGDSAASSARLSVHDFLTGKPYGAKTVAALFGRSDQWIRDMLKAGRLKGTKLDGVGPWMIDGESVRVLYGQILNERDRLAPRVPSVPLAKAVKRARDRLDAINAAAKKATKAKGA